MLHVLSFSKEWHIKRAYVRSSRKLRNLESTDANRKVTKSSAWAEFVRLERD